MWSVHWFRRKSRCETRRLPRRESQSELQSFSQEMLDGTTAEYKAMWYMRCWPKVIAEKTHLLDKHFCYNLCLSEWSTIASASASSRVIFGSISKIRRIFTFENVFRCNRYCIFCTNDILSKKTNSILFP